MHADATNRMQQITRDLLTATCTGDLLPETYYGRLITENLGAGRARDVLVRALTTKLRKSDSRHRFCATGAGKSA